MSNGTSIFKENIYGNNRFKYIEEINKFGGVFRLHNSKTSTIVMDGSNYFPSEGTCTDIRGGIALLLAALSASGCSTIYNVYHIFRGYQFIVERINSLGGSVKLID
jgi:UDP-N-acetylglucosamine 1-carboxyvinyltransferase